MMRLGKVRLKLAARVVEQTGVAAQLQAVRRHFELDGKIPFALQPRLDDQLAILGEFIFQPAQLRRQHFRLEQAQRVAAGHAKGFFRDDFVVSARTDFRNRGQRCRHRIYGDADFIFGAKPVFNFRSGRNNFPQKIRAPRF